MMKEFFMETEVGEANSIGFCSSPFFDDFESRLLDR
jgi:hypothetical protein